MGIAAHETVNVWSWEGVNMVETDNGKYVTGELQFDHTPNTEGMKAYVDIVEAPIDGRKVSYKLSDVNIKKDQKICILLVFADGTYYSFTSENIAEEALISANAKIRGRDFLPEFLVTLKPDSPDTSMRLINLIHLLMIYPKPAMLW